MLDWTTIVFFFIGVNCPDRLAKGLSSLIALSSRTLRPSRCSISGRDKRNNGHSPEEPPGPI